MKIMRVRLSNASRYLNSMCKKVRNTSQNYQHRARQNELYIRKLSNPKTAKHIKITPTHSRIVAAKWRRASMKPTSATEDAETPGMLLEETRFKPRFIVFTLSIIDKIRARPIWCPFKAPLQIRRAVRSSSAEQLWLTKASLKERSWSRISGAQPPKQGDILTHQTDIERLS